MDLLLTLVSLPDLQQQNSYLILEILTKYVQTSMPSEDEQKRAAEQAEAE
jgi:hypothetical protein